MPRQRFQNPTLQKTTGGVWFIRPYVDVIREGKVDREKKTIPIGSMGKREAQARANQIMATINRADYVIASQINVGDFLEEYERMHVDRLAASTRNKYRTHLKNHIRPAFASMQLGEMQPMLVQRWLDAKGEPTEKGKPGLSWATRTDLRNILSSMFSQAINWGLWKDQNPIERVHAGRKVEVREKRKLSDEDTIRLLAAVREDVRLMSSVALFCGLRVSEVLGLQERHVDLTNGVIRVQQRFYRGDLDVTKSTAGKRDVPLGYLVDPIRAIWQGDPDHFLFSVTTYPKRKRPRQSRDDRDILQHFLRPAAKALGIYWKGFGWHSLRREAVTAMSAALGWTQAMRMMGHTRPDMTLLYTLSDQKKQDEAIRDRQKKLRQVQ